MKNKKDIIERIDLALQMIAFGESVIKSITPHADLNNFGEAKNILNKTKELFNEQS